MKHRLLFALLVVLAASCIKSKDDVKHDYRCTTTLSGAYVYNHNTITSFYTSYRYDTLKGVDTTYVQTWVKLPGNYYQGDSTVTFPSQDTTVFYTRNTSCRRL